MIDKLKDLEFLLNYCNTLPDLYNEISLRLYKDFFITGAEIALLITYFVNEMSIDHAIKEAQHGTN